MLQQSYLNTYLYHKHTGLFLKYNCTHIISIANEKAKGSYIRKVIDLCDISNKRCLHVCSYSQK